MRTKEFTQKVEAFGFLVHDGHCYLEVKDTEGRDVVDILKAKRWIYDCEFEAFESLHEVKQTELMEIVTEYVTTQSKDREEEKKYYLQLNVPLLKDNGFYLQRLKTKGSYTVGSHFVNKNFDVIFTESEISQMDVTGFKKEEVK